MQRGERSGADHRKECLEYLTIQNSFNEYQLAMVFIFMNVKLPQLFRKIIFMNIDPKNHEFLMNLFMETAGPRS